VVDLLTVLYFYPRCTSNAERSWTEIPLLREIAPEHFVSCMRAGELNQSGINIEEVSIHDDAGVDA